MAFILESGAMRGKIIPAGKMIAYIWRGMQVVKCPPSEIHMPLTERAAEHRKSWSESGRIWKRYDLPKQGLWNAAAGALGSAYHQQKIQSSTTPGQLIRRSRGVLMSGHNYFKKCYDLRKTAEFESVEDLAPPFGVPKPAFPLLTNCFYDAELDGVVLEIEEPNLLTFEETYKNLELLREELRQQKEQPNPQAQTLTALEQKLRQFEWEVKEIERQGKSPIDYIYEEQRIIVWSRFSHYITSDAIITTRVDLPFPDPLKNADGTERRSRNGRRLMHLAFTDLPTSTRRAIPSGYVHVPDLSLATITFQAETIVAWKKTTGAVGSATSNIAGVKTPEKTHQAAQDLSAHLREHNKARLQRQRQPAKVEPPTLPS